MAKDFDVPYLGCVPIDPMFIRLIEEGRRPVYPKGTIVQGEDLANGYSNGVDIEDKDLLVEKYTFCSLYPLFDSMVKQVVTSVDQTKR